MSIRRQSLSESLDAYAVLFVCGSGGVGKTSVSAALAVNEALAGRKVCVLTIDPARRLADAMGLKHLDDKERKVTLPKGGERGGELWALMLDPKKAFDRLIAETAPDAKSRKRVYENRVYQQISTYGVGMQEYMAIERLYELDRTQKYDLIIVDTPPTQHAQDLIASPHQMLRFLEGRSLRWFLKPGMRMGKVGLKAIGGPSGLVMQAVQKVTGVEMLSDVSEFFELFEGMYESIKQRIRIVERIFADQNTGFCVVSSAERRSIDESIEFAATLDERHLNFAGAIVNRVEPPLGDAVTKTDLELVSGIDRKLATSIVAVQRDHARLSARDHTHIHRLEQALGPVPLVEVPRLPRLIRDLDSLGELAPYLYV